MLDRVKEWARGVDQWVQDKATADMYAARAAGAERNRAMILSDAAGNYRDEVIQRIKNGMSAEKYAPPDEATLQQIRQDLTTDDGRRMIADRYGYMMRRGPGGHTGRGIRERISQEIAQNPYVRRGAMPAAVGTGTVMGGMALTEGAQQLLALMEYMNQGQQTAERVESSPLA